MITWFCVFPQAVYCHSVEGNTGFEQYSSEQMCKVVGNYGAHKYRKFKPPVYLFYVCTFMPDVYKPVMRPKKFVGYQGGGLPWPEVRYRLID